MKVTSLGCVLFALLLALAPTSAFGDSACISGTLSSLVGTTCDIGDKAFDFTSFLGTGITASQIELTIDTSNPLAPGFTLTGVNGPITLSALNSQLFGQLDFTVSTLSGNPTLLGTTVTLTNPTASGAGSNIVDAFDFIANGSDNATVGHPGPFPEVCIDTQPGGGSGCVPPPFPATLSATGTFSTPQSTTNFGQLGFELLTSNGTATFNSATYTFNEASSVPEPGTNIFLGIVIFAFLGKRALDAHRSTGEQAGQ